MDPGGVDISTTVESYHLDFLLLIGIATFFGTVGARIFQKLHVPRVVGYIAIGILLGESGVKVIPAETVTAAQPITIFALGIIGFMIGGELHIDLFRRHGKQIITILITEGLGAFLTVSILTTLIGYWVFGSFSSALALGLVLGSIASATAPAETTNILQEYKTRGALTTAVLAIVALDDALAMTLFEFASSVAGGLTGRESNGLLTAIGEPLYEIFGAILIGVVGGLVLDFILRRIPKKEKTLTFALSFVCLTLGLAITLEVEVILAAMALGLTLTNVGHKRSENTFQLVEQFAPPIHVLFFVFVGARLRLEHMEWWMWLIVAVYMIGQIVGKVVGAGLGARWSGAQQKVRKYLGMCLFCQGGVAIGLAILASQRFEQPLGDAILAIVTSALFLIQLIGPPLVKLGMKKAGEIGLNITLEDMIDAHRIGEVMDADPALISEDAPMIDILRTFSHKEYLCYPVVDREHRLRGLLSFKHLRKILATEGIEDVLVAYDLMEPVTEKARPSESLREAVDHMRTSDLDYLPVVSEEGEDKLVGFLALNVIERRLTEEILQKQKHADS